jgi:glucan phosphoethanolaminetransferase (alkaline phosphatase superfamily)
MNSLTNICVEKEEKDSLQQIETQERIVLGIIASLVIVLWLRDSRNWKQIGSIIFIIVTIFTLIAMFYYSTVYPSLSILSLWLFFEWIALIFGQKENSKNSLHFSFMKF